MDQVDMLVIGSGPAGRRAAVQSAKLGKSVLVVDRRGSTTTSACRTSTRAWSAGWSSAIRPPIGDPAAAGDLPEVAPAGFPSAAIMDRGIVPGRGWA